MNQLYKEIYGCLIIESEKKKKKIPVKSNVIFFLWQKIQICSFILKPYLDNIKKKPMSILLDAPIFFHN